MITVNFRNQSGEIRTRRFALGEGISIYGSIANMVGLPTLFTSVRIEVPETGFLDETTTNLFGDYSSWFIASTEARQITVKITAKPGPLEAQETSIIPIAVGTSTRLLPVTVPPPSTLPGGLGEILPSWNKVFFYGGAILLIVVAVYFLPVWLSRVTKAIKK